MQIRHAVSGGIAYFPGLARPRVLDTETLPSDQAAELQRLVEESDFFALPETVGSIPRGAADMRQHTLTVEQEGRAHTVRISEPNDDSVLGSLLRLVQEHLNSA